MKIEKIAKNYVYKFQKMCLCHIKVISRSYQGHIIFTSISHISHIFSPFKLSISIISLNKNVMWYI